MENQKHQQTKRLVATNLALNIVKSMFYTTN